MSLLNDNNDDDSHDDIGTTYYVPVAKLSLLHLDDFIESLV